MEHYLIWFLLGAGFVVAELMLPGFIVGFFALGAWIVAALTFFFPALSLEWQLAVFTIASIAPLLTLRRYALGLFREQTSSGDDAADDIVGRQGELTAAVAPGRPGRMKFRGSYWTVRSNDDLAPGTMVTITGRDPSDSNVLIVTLSK